MDSFLYKLRELHCKFKYVSMNKNIKVQVVAVIEVRKDLYYFYIRYYNRIQGLYKLYSDFCRMSTTPPIRLNSNVQIFSV